MSRLKRSCLYLALFTALCNFCACSLFNSYKPTPEVKLAVLGVTNDYLRLIVQGKTAQAEGMVLWIPYVAETRVTKERFRNAIVALKGRFPLDNHPLLSLQLVELKVEEDDAMVILKKSSRPEQPNVVVRLQWIGNAWLVIDDSIFKTGGVLDYLKVTNT